MLTLHSRVTGRPEPVVPRRGALSLYVCGVTPYDTTHLGHAFTYVVFDVLVRYLRHSGIEVTYAQNVTDIDDDILRKAKELGLPYDRLAARETAAFQGDMAALNVLPPDAFVPATSIMGAIVAAVERLLGTGAAYVSDGNVYFDSTCFPSYGALVHGDRQEMLRLAAEHGGHPEDARKRDPLDFLLWQRHLPEEPAWASPFGPGRPGWHIECSTIASTVLGTPVDIHGGGSDLIFPHHESEIAQAETLTGIQPFVRHWMHTGMVRMDGEKMSKSLGNMVFIRELLTSYSADAIRLYLLSHHYRDSFEWKRDELDSMALLAAKLNESAPAGDGHNPAIESLGALMADDLGTDKAVAELSRLVGEGSGDTLGAAARWAAAILGLALSGSSVGDVAAPA